MKKGFVITAFALSGWALCAAVMGIGASKLGLNTALIVHAFAAPVIFIQMAYIYFKKFNYTTPVITAAVFTGIVMFMDLFLVALIINRNFDMFKSITGTWLPFILIFAATWATGSVLKTKNGGGKQ